jgi:hypothetical protein
MLRLLTVALPLVVALLATFDEHEVDALQLEVQSPLQFQPSQDKTFSSPTAVGETPGSSYQLHEDNTASAAAGQGATQFEVQSPLQFEVRSPPQVPPSSPSRHARSTR